MSVEPTTISERYSRAMHSSRLTLDANRRTDLDIIMAAGMAMAPNENDPDRRSRIGPMLLRLLAEYDEVRGQRAVARRNHDAASTREHAREDATLAVARANGMRQRRGEAPMTPAELQACIVKAGDDLRDQIAHDAKMAHAFVLMRLSSLATVRTAFGEWALVMANKRKFMDVGPIPMVDPDKSLLVAAWRKGKAEQSRITLALAGRVLDLVLDPNCYRCEGRGFNGGYNNTPQRLCNDMRKGGCGGSGRRNTKVGKTKEEDDFAGYLLTEVEIMLGRATREMRDRLRDTPAGMATA